MFKNNPFRPGFPVNSKICDEILNFEFRNFEFQSFFRFCLIRLTTTRLFENRMKPEVTGNGSPNRDRHFQLSGFHSMYTRPLNGQQVQFGDSNKVIIRHSKKVAALIVLVQEDVLLQTDFLIFENRIFWKINV